MPGRWPFDSLRGNRPMSWNAFNKWPRLKKALQRRGLDPESININDLADVLLKRGITDRTLNTAVSVLIGLLEPPGCWMTHCKHYGNSNCPQNCGLERVPGRCQIYRAYRKRKDERKKEAAASNA